MYLLGGIVFTFVLWTFVSTFLFTKEEIETIINYTLSRKKITTSLPTVNIDLVKEINNPLPNPIFNEVQDFSFLDDAPTLTTNTTTIGYSKLNIQPLQRKKLHRRSHSINTTRPKHEENYLKRATTRRIIDNIKVCGKKQVKTDKEKQIETAYLLLCTTKTSSFVSVQTLNSIQKLQKTISDHYSITIPLSFTSNEDTKEILNTYFNSILCHNFLRSANEVVNTLYQSKSDYVLYA